MMRLLLLGLLVLLFIVTSFGQKGSMDPQLKALVESERAFAKTCTEIGVRASFTKFFADDGISFTPHPVNTREDFRNRPAPPGPQPFTLNWEPIFADISQAGDLGYTTGPVISTDNAQKRPPRYAFYFSIWKKQSNGDWRVLIDYGIGVPAPPDPNAKPVFEAATPSGWKVNQQKVDVDAARSELTAVERELSNATSSGDIARGYSRYLMDESRMHRDSLSPILSKKAIANFISSQQLKKISFETIGVGVAQSADLGYSYGKYEIEKTSGIEKGYVVRVWKRDSHGQWKIVADVANALPPDK